MAKPAATPKAFRTPSAFRAWLEKHHATASELEVRIFKVHAAHRGLTYAQALDEALCFGWIDGVIHTLDEDSFRQRFTPRKARSTWSRRNLVHVERLKKAGRMAPAGLAAYEARDQLQTPAAWFDEERPELSPQSLQVFRANEKAWAYFQAQAPSYRHMTSHWVMSAKKEETRARRLGILIDCCARGRKIPPLEALSANRVRRARR
jgi:uncharacterized protein YdeI (YjbR/CyaY-like superfamily)